MSGLSSTADIRKLLAEAFNDEELTSLCFDFFRDVCDQFTLGMTKGHKIQLLIEHCERREAISNLLAAIQRVRPEQYEKWFPPVPRVEARPELTRPDHDPKQLFISYAHEDTEFAHRLTSDLRQRGWRVWIAPDSIRPGEKWVEAIERGLDESGRFVLVITPAATKSHWVKSETNIAIELQHKGQIRFIPLNVEPCDVPLFWTEYQHVPFGGNYEDGLTALLAALTRESVVQITSSSQIRVINWLRTHLFVTYGLIFSVVVACVLVIAVSSFGGIFPVNKQPTPVDSMVPKQSISTPTVRLSITPSPTSLPTGLVIPTFTAISVLEPKASPIVTSTAAGINQESINIPDEMVLIPAGEFVMGSDTGENDERPVHKVALDAFWMDKYEVTNADFENFVTETRYQTDAEKDGWGGIWAKGQWNRLNGVDWRSPTGDVSAISAIIDHPVVQVSWNDANAFCQWIGKRLPTEAEWEKAARDTDGRVYPWGNEYDIRKLNSTTSGEGGTKRVGSYEAGKSPYGAYDMAGNVWEWVADWYESDYYSRSPHDNPQGPLSGKLRDLRGGAWDFSGGDSRSSDRGALSPNSRGNTIGFRCARSLR